MWYKLTFEIWKFNVQPWPTFRPLGGWPSPSCRSAPSSWQRPCWWGQSCGGWMGRPSRQESLARRASLSMTEIKCINLIFVVSVGNLCCTTESVPTVSNSSSTSSWVSEQLLSAYLESNPTFDDVPEAPLATEENLEDVEALPYWYTVEANTAACLMIRNRANGSHLIYWKRPKDYIVIPEQSFAHIERDTKLWPNVFYTLVGLNASARPWGWRFRRCRRCCCRRRVRRCRIFAERTHCRTEERPPPRWSRNNEQPKHLWTSWQCR